ncbi:hypothetical protein [Roseococcus sp.]|uniref:hypothetical protein n=1 Tax=Roseococcus sp. TaxID=2109646 RepID=UPI003BA94515
MAKLRHLVTKHYKGRALHYWQPSAALRGFGWRPMGLPDDPAAAATKAGELNDEVDAWRSGVIGPNAPPAALERSKREVAGTISALIRDYKASSWWDDLAERTQAEYGTYLHLIEKWAGDVQARAITGPAVQAFYKACLERAEGKGKDRRVIRTPARAAAAIRVLRLLLQSGERLGYLKPGTNPAANPKIKVRRQRDPQLWSPAAVAHIVAVADRLGWHSIGTAVMLNEWIGQREADVIALMPWAREQGALVLRQGKSRRRIALPIQHVPHLVERLEAESSRPGRVRSLTRLLLNERTGKPWATYTFVHTFAEIRSAAAQGLPADSQRGLPEMPGMPEISSLWFMELRHTAVTRLHEAGVDDLGIAGVTGHTPKSVRAVLDRHYLVRTEKAAARAFRQRIKAEAEEA